MATFTFGFAGDDIDADADGNTAHDHASDSITNNARMREVSQQSCATFESVGSREDPLPAQCLNVKELLDSLPSKIAYSSVAIESPGGKTLVLSKRELFDVRMQLMAEDSMSETKSGNVQGLGHSDVERNVYEGGFKTWESSLDLARLLLDRGPRKDLDDLVRVNAVVELGCGSAIPSLVLWHYALQNDLPLLFTLADYNDSVLRLVTLPNLLLAYHQVLSRKSSIEFEAEGDLEITPDLITSFMDHLTRTAISLTLLAGSWSPTLVNLAPLDKPMSLLLLASETIYSLDSLNAFTETLLHLLSRVSFGKAIIAAKRLYFGVGGSVDALKSACADRGAVVAEIEDQAFFGPEEGGVKRCLLEVQMA